MTEIESASFIDSSAHWVSSFSLSEECLNITIHSSCNSLQKVQVVFTQVTALRIDTTYGEGGFSPPWDIIGMDSKSMPNGMWEFVLHTDIVEFSFQSTWPSIWRNEND